MKIIICALDPKHLQTQWNAIIDNRKQRPTINYLAIGGQSHNLSFI